MLALVRLAIRSPEGLAALLDEDVIVIFKPRRSELWQLTSGVGRWTFARRPFPRTSGSGWRV